MTLMQRRRALMGAKAGGTTIIRGSDLIWEQGTIGQNGADSTNVNSIRTSGYYAIKNAELTFSGQILYNTDKHYYAYVAEYDENHSFISRWQMLLQDGSIKSVPLNPSCAYVRFLYGHYAADDIPCNVSEGANFSATAVSVPSDYNPSYVSSTGRTYYRFHTATLSNQTMEQWLTSMGLMENLEELTFTGQIMYVTTSSNIGNLINGKLVWSTYAPNLTALYIIPKYIGGLSSRLFNFGHYAFSGLSKMKTLQLGGLSGDGFCYFNTGGYFRDDNGTKTVGTSAGLNLNVYRTAYNALGGFGNGTKASNTVVTCYNKDTGEVMTS